MEEQKALPDMVLAVQVICVAAFAGSETLAALAKTNREMLKMLMANEQRLHTFTL